MGKIFAISETRRASNTDTNQLWPSQSEKKESSGEQQRNTDFEIAESAAYWKKVILQMKICQNDFPLRDFDSGFFLMLTTHDVEHRKGG